MLDGRWKAVYAELGGNLLTPDIVATIELLLDGGRYTLGNDHGTYTVNTAVAPHEMDVAGAEGPNAGRTIPAIFLAAGDDLIICYNLGGGARPAAFASHSGTQEFLVRYARAS